MMRDEAENGCWTRSGVPPRSCRNWPRAATNSKPARRCWWTLNTLIRDLEPVLKRVAGGDVDIQLQDVSSPLNVDVGTEQVERLLVNLASYGRGRMPSGGRLRIELGTIVVDRRFATKHPNVRLGLHAMITVTEVRRAARTDGPPDPRAQRPGVDFGTLQGLVSECGGHLWMKVLPLGEMVAKIRLPLSSPQDQTDPSNTGSSWCPRASDHPLVSVLTRPNHDRSLRAHEQLLPLRSPRTHAASICHSGSSRLCQRRGPLWAYQPPPSG